MSAWTTGTLIARQVGDDIVIDQADQTIMVAAEFFADFDERYVALDGDVLTFTASNGTWRYRLSGLNEDGQQAWLFVREDVDLL